MSDVFVNLYSFYLNYKKSIPNIQGAGQSGNVKEATTISSPIIDNNCNINEIKKYKENFHKLITIVTDQKRQQTKEEMKEILGM